MRRHRHPRKMNKRHKRKAQCMITKASSCKEGIEPATPKGCKETDTRQRTIVHACIPVHWRGSDVGFQVPNCAPRLPRKREVWNRIYLAQRMTERSSEVLQGRRPGSLCSNRDPVVSHTRDPTLSVTLPRREAEQRASMTAYKRCILPTREAEQRAA